ncbi:tRNA (adenosine(37)-N6)-dimethylallyltransferase MiaA [Croceicoccus gelatinilyticus]|uniref:tRNA (adenosine(37)-N6)-dimethylallyltransferase MiaA n=1 Tax=Croceicoccus gelatinilyticus TaxID=2835536 RepID=UPI001BD00FBA|nr:tRNA (adenosine(37)-N6)-dimethylallyltransferase MiaA [Croceicoccus gelatinilyticus]MBS7671026.1 tRNA (adenosine(37)-N6)-dimethylallyltransferase MiaA [Croceicoccus gelatinilyticus]
MSTDAISFDSGRSNNGEKPRVALIAGPTASGKSDLAVDLALAAEKAGLPATVINADSAQVYADLRVLSARPSEEEMRGVRHVLFGAWDGADPCSAADWAARAKQEIAKAHSEDRMPILVGGTGLYLRTLIDGIAPIPAIDPAIREEIRSLDVADAHAALTSEDPEAAARLNPADTTRVARALEVVRSTGHPMAYWQQRLEGGIGDRIELTAAILIPERETLYEKCDRRFDLMLELGAVEEVRALLARDLDPDLPVMRAIGVPEIAGLLNGSYDEQEAANRGAQATRRYAKRQYTWFRHQPPEGWTRFYAKNFTRDDIIATLLRDLRLT